MLFSSIGGFVHYITKHKIPIDPKKRLIGVRDVMIGWALIAAASVFFKVPSTTIFVEINFAIQFGTGVLLIALGSLLYGLVTGKWLDFILIRNDESHIGKATLTLKQRILLIYIRGFLATAGYMAFELAKDRIGIVENSAIQVTLLTFFILRQHFNLREWIGILIAILGISSVLYYDTESSNQMMTIWGYLLGGGSAICLAILIILSSIIVKHDHPIRITFHQCLCGLILALTIIAFSGNGISIFNLTLVDLYNAFFSGACYTCALIFFFRAFLFLEPFVIAMSGYSLVIFTSIFESIVNRELVTSRDLLSSLLIAIGCGILIFQEYLKESKKPDGEKALDLSRFLCLKDNKLLNLQKKYGLGEINKYEYISEMHENVKMLFELSSFIKQRPIEQISIENGSVIFKLEPHSIELEVDKACRSAPFEVLHFGEYEQKKIALTTRMLQDGDVILDVGAHLGWYSLSLAKQFPKLKIHAFEPLKHNFDILERNIKRNLASNVIPHPFGLADHDARSKFYYFELVSPLGSPKNVLNLDQYQTIPCKLKKLDDVVQLQKIERIDFIKCDTAGNDLPVLRGAEKSLVKFTPILNLDLIWNEKFGYSPTDILNFLKNYGYDCFSISKTQLKLIRTVSVELANREKTPYFFLHKQKHQQLIHQFAGKKI